jgi:hypothetical protein
VETGARRYGVRRECTAATEPKRHDRGDSRRFATPDPDGTDPLVADPGSHRRRIQARAPGGADRPWAGLDDRAVPARARARQRRGVRGPAGLGCVDACSGAERRCRRPSHGRAELADPERARAGQHLPCRPRDPGHDPRRERQSHALPAPRRGAGPALPPAAVRVLARGVPHAPVGARQGRADDRDDARRLVSLPTRRGPAWYGLSRSTFERGFASARQHQVLEVRTLPKLAPLSPTGWTEENFYRLMPPFGPVGKVAKSAHEIFLTTADGPSPSPQRDSPTSPGKRRTPAAGTPAGGKAWKAGARRTSRSRRPTTPV